jgi:hypothetical protein
MKQLFIKFYILFTSIACLAPAACNNETTKKDNMNKQNQSAEVQTIANMQEAYKGEKTASAKYEAFSIKAEAEGYHQICLL